MAKELPYFKFTIAEWLLGRISHETYAVKGMFIDACAHYWHKECQVTEEEMERKVGKKGMQQLLSLKYLERTGAGISIAFLDEEYEELSDLKGKRSQAGKKGRAAQLGQTPDTGKQIAGHLDKIRGDKKREDEIAAPSNKQSLAEIFWTDLPNSTYFATACNDLARPKDEMLTKLPEFKKSRRTDYKNMQELADHFKFWCNKQTWMESQQTGTIATGYKIGQKPIGG